MAKTVGSGTTQFVYDESGHLLGEYIAGMPVQETVWLGDMPLAVLTPGNVFYVHADQLNTPRQIDDATQAVVWSWDTFTFGSTAPVNNPSGALSGVGFSYNLRFSGQYADPESGLNYNWHRFYDATRGAFTSVDPLGLAARSWSVYAYADSAGILGHGGCNPISCIDPWGLDTIALGLGFSGNAIIHATGSLQASLSWNPSALSDLSQWRVGGVFSVVPGTGASTGFGGSGGLVATYSKANCPEAFKGWSGYDGASGGLGIVGGFDVGNIGSGPKTYNFSLGIGLETSPEFAGAPAEGHAGAGWTAAGSFGL